MSNESLRIKVGNRELLIKEHFKYLRSLLTKDKIKMRTSMAKEAFNRKYHS
jgi:hypothetical protein